MNFRRVPFSTTQNTRDLGGYATPQGATRWNVFYRSACPVDFTEEDWTLLEQCNIGAMIDLRGGFIGDETMGLSQNVANLKRYRFPLGSEAVPRHAKNVPQSYMQMLQRGESWKNIFDVFATEQKAVLFHCFAGKDRTGVLSAVLLMLAGVSDVDIIADYCTTYPYFLPRLRQDFLRTDAEKYVFVPIPEHMEGFLKLFREQYGTVQNFLESVGVDAQQKQKVLEKFVEKRPL